MSSNDNLINNSGQFDSNHLDQTFSFTPPTNEFIYDLLLKLPSSFHSNNMEIPPGILKILAPLIVEPLKIIFTQSFNEASFCQFWKTSFIMPLKKVSNPSSPSDFTYLKSLLSFQDLGKNCL